MYPELIKLMAVNGMKHKDLAEVIGVSQPAASLKLNGTTEFKRSEMQKVKEYFKKIYPEITMDQIFTKEIFLSQ